MSKVIKLNKAIPVEVINEQETVILHDDGTADIEESVRPKFVGVPEVREHIVKYYGEEQDFDSIMVDVDQADKEISLRLQYYIDNDSMEIKDFKFAIYFFDGREDEIIGDISGYVYQHVFEKFKEYIVFSGKTDVKYSAPKIESVDVRVEGEVVFLQNKDREIALRTDSQQKAERLAIRLTKEFLFDY